MKIAVITSSFPRFRGDGVGSFIYSLMDSLSSLDHDVQVLAPYDPAVVADWQTNVPVERVRFVWPESLSRLGHAHSLTGDVRLKWQAYPLVILFSLFSILRLQAAVRRQRSDVIYAQWLLPGGFIGAIASGLTGVPLIISVHGSDVFVAERHRFFKPFIRFTLRAARHVIACSADLARRVAAQGMPQDQISVVPYGVAIERFAPDPEAALIARESLSLPDGCNVVMVMGRLVHKKGFSHFLQAVPLVVAQHPSTVFVVAGEGDLRTELENLAQSLNIQQPILFTGHIPWDQTPSHLAMADVFVVPSVLDKAGNVDGLPNVLLESMASGCAIVASDVAGIPEIITDGENGLLVPQRDVTALARAIDSLLEDPSLRHRLGNAARQTVASHLGWPQIAAQVAAILEASGQETK